MNAWRPSPSLWASPPVAPAAANEAVGYSSTAAPDETVTYTGAAMDVTLN
jgi:hypothetical protein